MGKKRSPAPDDNNAKKKTKQLSIAVSLAAQRGPAPSALVAEVVDSSTPLLDPNLLQDVEIANDRYLKDWGEKCKVKSGTEADVGLDGSGMKAVTAFRHAVQLADARGAVLDPSRLEFLALIMRNDCVHHHSHVSRAAHAALIDYLASHPYARLARYEEGSGPYAGCPYVITTPRSAWLPLQEDRNSFSSKYLLAPDMSLSGQSYNEDVSGGSGASFVGRRRGSATNRRMEPCELVLDFVGKALNSAKVDFNGDLLTLQYLIVLLEQDLEVRLQAHAAYGHARFEGDDRVADKRRALLENSLAWRVFDCSMAAQSGVRESLVAALVKLVVGPASVNDAFLADVEDEPDDDAPAAACAFTGCELSALASRLLNAMLSLYGAAEGAGAFFSRGAFRAGKDNLRMDVDRLLLGSLWAAEGAIRGSDAARVLLRSLPPRDALRLLGQLAAQKLATTYNFNAPLGPFNAVVGDLRPLKEASDFVRLNRGNEVERFFEVNAAQAVSSLHREPARSVITYRSVNHLAVVVGGVAVAAAALLTAGEEVPCGQGGVAELKRELAAAAQAVATQARDGKGAHQLSRAAAAELVAAQMAVAAMG